MRNPRASVAIAVARRAAGPARHAAEPARRALAAALIVAMLAPAAPAFGADVHLHRTNVEMAEEAIRGALREALQTFPPATADLRLVPLGTNDVNPLVEGVLVEELAARGYPVEIATPQEVRALAGEAEAEAGPAATEADDAATEETGDDGSGAEGEAEPADSVATVGEGASGADDEGAAAEGAPAEPGQASGAASTSGETPRDKRPRKPGSLAAQLRAARDSLAALHAEGATPESSIRVSSIGGPMSDAVSESDVMEGRALFSYRVTDFSFRYADIYRKLFVGPKRIRRLAQVELHMRLTEDGGRRVVWSKNVRHSASDVIPYGSAALLESASYAFAKPERSPGFLARLYEPLVVGGIVGGLVFLFYSNQSGD